MGEDWSGVNAQVADLAVRDRQRCSVVPRLRSWFADLAERFGLPDVRIELDPTLYERERHGEFEALRSGELVIRIYPYADEGQMWSTLEHEAAHLLRYDPALDDLRTEDCHDGAFDRALTWIRSGVAPTGEPPAPRRQARSRSARRPAKASAARSSGRMGDRVRSLSEAKRQGWGPGHRNWSGHGAVDCALRGLACDVHTGVTADDVRRAEERGSVRVSGGRAAVER